MSLLDRALELAITSTPDDGPGNHVALVVAHAIETAADLDTLCARIFGAS